MKSKYHHQPSAIERSRRRKYRLPASQVNPFKVELLTDRLGNIDMFQAAARGLVPRHKFLGRTDMCIVKYDGPLGEFRWFVDPVERGIELHSDSSPQPPEHLTATATKYFMSTSYPKQMVGWYRQIQDAEKQAYAGLKWETCSICGHEFLKGTKHEHFANESGVWPYQGTEEVAAIEVLGLKPNWGAGYGRKRTPTLESAGFSPEWMERMADDEEFRKRALKARHYPYL